MEEKKQLWVQMVKRPAAIKYRVIRVREDHYDVDNPHDSIYSLRLPKTDYEECSPPTKWIDDNPWFHTSVPDHRVHSIRISNGLTFVLPEEYRFVMGNDGFFKIQKKVLDN